MKEENKEERVKVRRRIIVVIVSIVNGSMNWRQKIV